MIIDENIIESKIDDYYANINLEAGFYKKNIQLLYSIIEIKQIYKGVANHKKTLYVDIKSFIEMYISNSEKGSYNYGYDKYNKDKILEVIEKQPIEEQVEILILCKRILKKQCDDYHWVDEKLRCARRKLLKKKNRLLFILYLSSENITNILITFFIVWVLLSIITMNSPYEWMSFLYFNESRYASSKIINHFANILVWMFNIEDNVKIVPMNIAGLIEMIIIKLSYFLIMVNIIYKRFLIKTNIDE